MLPEDMMIELMVYNLKISQTNKKLNNIARQPQFWERLYEKDYLHTKMMIKNPEKRYKQTYAIDYALKQLKMTDRIDQVHQATLYTLNPMYINQFIQCHQIRNIFKTASNYIVTITPTDRIKITLFDESIDNPPNIKLLFTNRRAIKNLTIHIQSGTYFDKEYSLINGPDYHDEASYFPEKINIQFQCYNKIKELIVTQTVETESNYSYYNQDGFTVGEIKMRYNPYKYKNLKCRGNINISTHLKEGWDLYLCIK